jgi:type IV secretion system protein VirB9
MDPGRILKGRLLAVACAALALGGCATLQGHNHPSPPTSAAAAAPAVAAPPPSRAMASMAPIPNPPKRRPSGARAGLERASYVRPSSSQPAHHYRSRPRASGRAAISEANQAARETSTSEGFVGGVQVFAYDPARVYEVWTAPLRVTTLTLAPGETVVSKAAGDTVRWEIGETTSGEGPSQRAHVMIKPLRSGLETNLVLSTSQRVYLIELKSGSPESFNAAVSWDLGAVVPPAPPSETAEAKPQPLVMPAGPLDARYRIEAHGRRPAWSPTAVMTDGVRTFLTFPADLGSHEAPALFAIAPGGEAQLVNYRQQDGLWVVDRVLDQAELRLGDRHPQTVRIVRTAGARS